MNFNSLGSWLLVAGLVLLSAVLRRIAAPWLGDRRWPDLLLLAATSLCVFFSTDAVSACILVAEAGATLFLVRETARISGGPGAKVLLACNLVLILAVWCFMKFAFSGQGLGELAGGGGMPSGVSFYSFMLGAYAVDSFRDGKRLENGLGAFNFLCFFPILMAGPIERKHHLGAQMQGFRFALTAENLVQGGKWIILGLFFKRVLADNLALFLDTGPADNPYLILWATFLFGIRLYFDFAGYSFIALGLARCLGLKVFLNFLAPYMSTSIREFWRRWHATLMAWFRDMIYIPLGGSRKGWWFGNVFLVFLAAGFWHGTGWNFIIWGILHAVYMGLARAIGRHVRPPALLGWLLTYLAVTFAWLFFYETDIAVLGRKLATLGTLSAYGGANLAQAAGLYQLRDILPLAGVLAMAGCVFLCEWLRRREEVPYSLLLSTPCVLALAFLLPLLSAGGSTTFVYFAF